MRVLIAPDSFKGTMSAETAAAAIAAGWATRRPDDDVRQMPQADGGEGTASAVAAAVPGARWVEVPDVVGPDHRPHLAAWLALPDGTAVIELANASGLPLMPRLNPDRATTRGFGQLIADALGRGAEKLVLCLGGSASNDGGAGVMRALGALLLDESGREIVDGAEGLDDLHSIRLRDSLRPPPRGVTVLTDVTSPLLGPRGATAVFGPQKGITPERVEEFEHRLRSLAALLPHADPARPGMGAAGGTAFGISAIWPVQVVSGAAYVSELTGLAAALPDADLLITGEGCFDSQSVEGKVIGSLMEVAATHDVPIAIVAGRIDARVPGHSVDLAAVMGGAESAMRNPIVAAQRAGAALAMDFGGSSSE